MLELIEAQPDLPPGPTYRCRECGTRVRTGQPHSALEPGPHQTFEALTVASEVAADE